MKRREKWLPIGVFSKKERVAMQMPAWPLKRQQTGRRGWITAESLKERAK